MVFGDVSYRSFSSPWLTKGELKLFRNCLGRCTVYTVCLGLWEDVQLIWLLYIYTPQGKKKRQKIQLITLSTSLLYKQTNNTFQDWESLCALCAQYTMLGKYHLQFKKPSKQGSWRKPHENVALFGIMEM